MKLFYNESIAKSLDNVDELDKIEELEDIQDENEHIIDLWEPLEFNIDENYEYVPKSKVFSLLSNGLYYGIAFPILKVLMKIVYDFKIEGKENIRNLKEGAVTVSNHVLFLDCAMVGLAYGFKKVYFTTLEGSFKIPFVRKLIKLLRAIPIPESIKNKGNFIKVVDNILREENSIHVYPEVAMFPYFDKIRHFKNGAFDFAVRNNKPIVPMVFTFREPKGIRKIFKKKKDVTLTVLEPIRQSEGENTKQRIEDLKNQVYNEMKEINNQKYKECH